MITAKILICVFPGTWGKVYRVSIGPDTVWHWCGRPLGGPWREATSSSAAGLAHRLQRLGLPVGDDFPRWIEYSDLWPGRERDQFFNRYQGA